MRGRVCGSRVRSSHPKHLKTVLGVSDVLQKGPTHLPIGFPGISNPATLVISTALYLGLGLQLRKDILITQWKIVALCRTTHQANYSVADSSNDTNAECHMTH